MLMTDVVTWIKRIFTPVRTQQDVMVDMLVADMETRSADWTTECSSAVDAWTCDRRWGFSHVQVMIVNSSANVYLYVDYNLLRLSWSQKRRLGKSIRRLIKKQMDDSDEYLTQRIIAEYGEL